MWKGGEKCVHLNTRWCLWRAGKGAGRRCGRRGAGPRSGRTAAPPPSSSCQSGTALCHKFRKYIFKYIWWRPIDNFLRIDYFLEKVFFLRLKYFFLILNLKSIIFFLWISKQSLVWRNHHVSKGRVEVKCRASAANGLYESETIVNVPVVSKSFSFFDTNTSNPVISDRFLLAVHFFLILQRHF